MVFWTPVSDDGSAVFEPLLEARCESVWKSVVASVAGRTMPAIRSDLIRDTALRFSAVVADPIYQRFAALREAHRQTGRPFSFRAFENELSGGELELLIDRRPVLRRVLERVHANAVGAWTDIATAIVRDRPLLASEGLIQSPNEAVEYVRPGASDFHGGGRSATQVKFASSDLLFLKPRAGGADLAWNALLTDVGSVIGVDLPTIGLVDRGSHHWAAGVDHSRERGSLDLYYTQLGVLTFLVYLLQGTDIHCENLIATRLGPVIVDLEGLLHPTQVPTTPLDTATAVAFTALVTSVANTGLLPCHMGSAEGMGSIGGMNPPIESRSRRTVATDSRSASMEFETREVGDWWTAHTPLLPGETFNDEWIDSLLTGFRLAYRSCENGDLHEPILAAAQALRDTELRFIARPTYQYYNALHQLLAATFEPHEFNEYELLTKYLTSLPDAGAGDKLVDMEAQALAQLDIPRFIRTGGDLRVEMPGIGQTTLDGRVSPFESVTKRHRSLSATDLRFQESLLEASFGGLTTAKPLDSPPGGTPDGLDLLNVAIDCGQLVLASSVESDDGIAWIIATPVSDQGRSTLALCGIDLYAGLSGIGLFLGELYDATGEAAFKDGASRCVETVRRRLESEHGELGIGGGSGIGGILYAMSRLAVTLPESCAPEVASWLCGELRNREVAADKLLDVMDGAAGLLLGLTSFRDIEQHSDLEAVCVGTLLANLAESERIGLESWQTLEPGRCYSGMAHGSSGIAVALARYYSSSPSRAVRKAIEKALAFDRSVDLSADVLPVQWCHGAPGIALAHWDIGCRIPDLAQDVRDLIDTARSRTETAPDAPTDGTCCGSTGRVAALFHTESHRASGETPWETLAEAISLGRRRNTTFRWSAGSDSRNPGLFVGTAGIGLEFLQIARGRRGLTPLLFS